jgi:plastocyanin
MIKKSYWKPLGVGGAVGLLALGCFWWMQKEKVNPVKPMGVQSGTATIHITEDGFVPTETQITPGTVVRFINDDEYWHWPASDPHPTHTFYSEIDPQEPVAPKASWEVTVTKPGIWGLHDHLAPYIIGTLTVVE